MATERGGRVCWSHYKIELAKSYDDGNEEAKRTPFSTKDFFLASHNSDINFEMKFFNAIFGRLLGGYVATIVITIQQLYF